MKKIIFVLIVISVLIIPLNSAFASSTIINPGTKFTPGKWYWSPARTVFLVLQWDGNFVLYRYNKDGRNHIPLWATATDIGLQTRAYFQGDGNLVVYYNDTALWDSGTWGYPETKLLIDDKGFLRIVDRTSRTIWRSDY